MGAYDILGYLSFKDSKAGSGGFGSGGDVKPTDPGLVAAASDRALRVWQGFAKDASVTPPRVAAAAYYYALQQIAVNFIAMRQGNIGSTNGGKVAGLIVEKAKALEQIAKPQIALFEQWCATEAPVYGAEKSLGDGEMSILSAGVALGTANKKQVANGKTAAHAYVKMVAADFATADLGMGSIDNWEKYGGFGYALKAQSAALLNRLPTVSDARNPAIGKHYQAMAQLLAGAGATITENFETVVKQQKINFAVRKSGL